MKVEPAAEAEASFGFNTEVSHREHTFHVQTENLDDPDSPTINTLVYDRGAVVWKVSSSYAELPRQERCGPALEDRVRRQHLGVVRQVKRGELGG